MAIDYFQELLAKYRNIQYPSSSQRQVDTLRNDLRREILTPQFEQARIEYQNMLAGTGVSRRSVDATEGGEQQQIIINPTTGATEIVTPEYNRQFRTDATDFNPGGSGIFQNIYDVDEGKIDPRTGRPKDEEVVEDTNTGLISDTGGRGEGRDKDQGSGVHTEVIGGRTFRFDEDGNMTQLDPESLDARFAQFMSRLLGFSAINVAKDLLGLDDDPNDVYSRIKEKYGEETATAFSLENAEAINKEMNTDAAARRAEVEANFRETATQAEKDRLDMTDRERGITTRESTGISRTPGDAGTAGDAAGFSGGANPSGQGQYGGR
jgi:hypothetical protein